MLKLDNNALLRDAAYIDGEWRGARSGARFAVKNPATGEVIAEIADLDETDARDAILAANRAWGPWRARSAKERAVLMRKWYELMMAAQEDLAQLMTAEQGKPLAESRGEIAYGASFIEWFAEEGKRIYGDVIPTSAAGRRIIVMKEPVGVVAAITPWNFPNAMITRKVGPALAAGCPIVIKPAQLTPLSALALAELAHRAGIPKGVVNVVPSTKSSRVGKELSENPLVRKFSFTGSTEVGKQLMRQCASTVKKISLELGGNAPFIVFDDADLDAAVEKVEQLIGEAKSKGAAIALGGKRHALGGTFFEPTIVRDVTTDMAVAREEIFGPVVTLFRFKEDADAIRMANDTEYGLAAYFYARDVGRIFRIMEGLEYGIIGINEGIISTEVAPFGGMKQSGIGREGSKYGIEGFLEIKYAAIGGLGAP